MIFFLPVYGWAAWLAFSAVEGAARAVLMAPSSARECALARGNAIAHSRTALLIRRDEKIMGVWTRYVEACIASPQRQQEILERLDTARQSPHGLETVLNKIEDGV